MKRWEMGKIDPVTVSVIMGVYNQTDNAALTLAVDSILGQTLTDFEFLIYDDGSHPEGAALLRAQAQRDERIRLIRCEENHGLAYGLARCVEASRGRYIARMDADDACPPERLEKQVRFLEQHPEYAWCGANPLLFYDGRIWGSRLYPEKPEASDYLRFSPFCHPSVVFRAEVLRAENYLSSPRTMRCEDYELFMRLQRKGCRGYNLQELLFYYREAAETYQRRTFRARWREMLIRREGFRALGLLPRGWLYVIRPVIAGLIPHRLVAWLKRKESDHSGGTDLELAQQAASILSKTAQL